MPTDEILLSQELKQFMETAGFDSLEMLLAEAPENLLKYDTFGWRLMLDVLKLREKFD
jgi:hypothetical protein